MKRNTQTGLSSSSGGAHQWTDYHRELLCVLSRFLKQEGQSDSHNRLFRGHQILWKIISDEIGRSGTEGFTESAPRVYLNSMHASKHHVWRAVFLDTDFSDTAQRWRTHRQKLIEAAEFHGIRLAPRTSDHRVHAGHIHAARAKDGVQRMTDTTGVLNMSATQGNQQTISDAIMIENGAQTMKLDQASPAVDDSYDDYSYATEVANAVAFRFFTPYSHSIHTVVDGAFVMLPGQWVGSIRDPPPRSSRDFLDSAFAHLRPLPKPSPFLSVTTSLFFALRKLLKEPDASLAVIRMGNLMRDGDSPSRLTRACGIIAKLKDFRGILRQSADMGTPGGDLFVGKEYRYVPNTEFLVWGEIYSDAIINVISRDDMEQFLRHNPNVDSILHISEIAKFEKPWQASAYLKSLRIKLTRRTGTAVGILAALLGLGQGHLERFAINVLRRWSIGTHKTARQRGRHSSSINESAYLRGFLDGWDIMATTLKQPLAADKRTRLQSPVVVDLTTIDDDEVGDDEAADFIAEAPNAEIEMDEDESYQLIDDSDAELLESSPGNSDTDVIDLAGESSEAQINTEDEDRRWVIVPSAEFTASQRRAEQAMTAEMGGS